MVAPTPYLHLPGTARDALGTYARVFGGRAVLHTYGDFGRDDGPPDLVAHGELVDGPVALFAADVTGEAPAAGGLVLALLGTAEPATLHRWFDGLAEGGVVVDPLQRRPWGASDGRVDDPFGVAWLVGYEGDGPAGA